jgi:hypothetical protein
VLTGDIKPSLVVRGPIFTQPVPTPVVVPEESAKLISKGLGWARVHKPVLMRRPGGHMGCLVAGHGS